MSEDRYRFYIKTVDSQLRKEGDHPTIGILLCKSKDKQVAEYALSDIHKPIGVSKYQLTQSLPEELKPSLPSVEDNLKGVSMIGRGNIIGLEALSLPEAFKQTWPTLIKSYSIDAIDMRMDNTTPPIDTIPPLEKGDKGGFDAMTTYVTNWLSTITPQNISIHKSPGLGNDIRWDETGTAGFVLDYNYEAVHTAVFAVGE